MVPLLPVVVGLGILVLTGSSPANPVDGATARALNELPFVVAEGRTPGQEPQLISLWVRYGLDQPLLYYRKTRELIDSSFDKLKKCMLESQRPGNGLDYGIQARFRALGNAADQRAMRANLRGWLEAPDSVLQGSPTGSLNIVYPHEAVARAIIGQREKAADMLADWQDSLSLRAVITKPAIPQSSRAAAEKALDRIRRPAKHEFIRPDGHGGILFTRSRADLVSMTMHRSASSVCPDTIRGERVSELWGLLQRCREGRHAAWFNDGRELRLTFRDGLIAVFRPTESGWIEYGDNLRNLIVGRFLIEAPEFYQAVKECLPERPLIH